MENIKILLVEDDTNLGFVIQDTLRMKGYTVHLCKDGKEGLQQFNKGNYDLCILDVMLPKKDGFSLAEDIRQTNEEIPIMFLTAKTMTEDKIKGFKAGCDDYLTKPFSTEEFLLRVKALLKRGLKSNNENNKFYQIGEFNFDYPNYKLEHKNGTKKLTKKEAEILKLLCEKIGNVVPRELLLNMIWGDDSYFNGRSLDVFITKLRKHLKDDPSINISNIHGVGFKLEA